MTYREAVRRAAKQALKQAVAKSPTVTAAAEKLGLNRTSFYRACNRLGVEFPRGRRGTWQGC